MHVGSAGNADGGCFHNRFQSPFYVQSQVFPPHCERFWENIPNVESISKCLELLRKSKPF